MARELYQGPFITPAPGGIVTEEPDGVTRDGQNSLRDSHSRPQEYNPDWPRRPVFPDPKDPV